MEVDQKHITTIRLHDAKGGEICLVKDGHDYQLKLASNSTVVNILLGTQDVRKLCQQIIQLDLEETWKTQVVTPPPDYKSLFFNGGPRSFHEAMAGWFAKMAGEFYEKPSKQTVS